MTELISFDKVRLVIKRILINFHRNKIFTKRKVKDKKKSITISKYSEANYVKWLGKNRLTEAKKENIKQEIAAFEFTPLISIIMPVYDVDPIWLDKAIGSVKNQLYTNWELCIVDDASSDYKIRATLLKHSRVDSRIKTKFLPHNCGIATALNEGFLFSVGQYISLLDHDDEISSDALYENVKLLNIHSDAQLIYSDKDKIDINGNRMHPFFKPDYSPDLLLSQNYICHFNVIARPLFEKIGGFRKGFEGSQDHDLFLRVAEQTEQIYHIPKILYHWRIIPDSTASGFDAKPQAWEAGCRAIQDALQRRKIEGTAYKGKFNGTYRVERKVLQNPLISIIIPIDHRIRFFKKCVEAILEKTAYTNFEILGVTNHTGADILDLHEYATKTDRKITVLNISGQLIGSKGRNQAAMQVKGEHLVFFNDMLEIITAEWIEALLEHSQRDKIGVVGGKYYLQDGRLLHAGIIVGIGNGIGYSHRFFDKDDVGYYAQTHIIRNVTGISVDCMMVKKSIFQHIGGFNERKLHLAYYDIDFCLRLMEMGLLNVFTPYCEAIYRSPEAVQLEETAEDIKQKQNDNSFFKERWQGILSQGDPYYNTNFANERTNFAFKL